MKILNVIFITGYPLFFDSLQRGKSNSITCLVCAKEVTPYSFHLKVHWVKLYFDFHFFSFLLNVPVNNFSVIS